MDCGCSQGIEARKGHCTCWRGLTGSDRNIDNLERSDEPDWFTLSLPDCAIGKYPETVSQDRYFAVRGGYRKRRYWPEAGWAWRKRYNWEDYRGKRRRPTASG